MRINLNEIREIFNDLVDRTEELGFKEIDTDTDYYWHVSSDERKNFGIQEPILSVGSLIDDYVELKKTLIGTNSHTTIDFDRIANIIIEIGNSISNSDKPYF